MNFLRHRRPFAKTYPICVFDMMVSSSRTHQPCNVVMLEARNTLLLRHRVELLRVVLIPGCSDYDRDGSTSASSLSDFCQREILPNSMMNVYRCSKIKEVTIVLPLCIFTLKIRSRAKEILTNDGPVVTTCHEGYGVPSCGPARPPKWPSRTHSTGRHLRHR